jgi:hypothetical protein
MQRNVVALADDEYDAMAGPLLAEAFSLIRQIAETRAYLLPVIIASLSPYAAADQAGEEGGQIDMPVKTPNLHRPHFRIHTGDSQ